MIFAFALVLAVFAGVVIYSSAPVQEQVRDARFTADIPMKFAHRDHAGEQCAVCHHNYIDDTGADTCVLCHLTREDLTHLVEDQFHDLCMGCHVEKQLEGAPHGPVRSCTACHLKDNQP